MVYLSPMRCLALAGVLAAAGLLIAEGPAQMTDAAQLRNMVNTLGMALVRVDPGVFRMGCEDGEFDERPVHDVRLTRAFHVGATEVTNAQYEQFDPGHRQLRGKLGFSTEDDDAVVFVSWHDAVRFCEWLTAREGQPYRLPTEAEWEYACRAGTGTAYHTGDALPEPFHKNVRNSWFPAAHRTKEDEAISLSVARTPANAWGLHDMHGNVEEWCRDWYGPYRGEAQSDPVGRADGDFRVTRGGSHSTVLEYLRSANRMGTLPDDRSWLIGFRVVLGELPETQPDPACEPPRHQLEVQQGVPPDLTAGPDPETPYFHGPRTYVKIPAGSEGPLFSKHNHCPAIAHCPNGDLLAIWYTCRTEPGRELGICASRLRYGQDEWEDASPFWDAPDRNDHASAMCVDARGVLYHFNGLSAAGTWGSLATIMRTSADSGTTWSDARLIMPEHGLHHMPIESVITLRSGTMLVPCDAVPSGAGGTAVLLSHDGGKTWHDPGEDKPAPDFVDGGSGAWVAGIHAGLVELRDGRLLAFGRGNNINGRMPMSISADGGHTWTYAASAFPPLGGGQRLVVLRLQEGPLFFASFDAQLGVTDAAGKQRHVSGLFGALSFDEGRTWPVKRLITDDKPARRMDGGGNTHRFTMSETEAEPRGYMSVCQAPNGLIHLLSSKLHYAFNLAWLKTPMPPAPPAPQARDLSSRMVLAYVFTPRALPSREANLRFNGSGGREADMVRFVDGEGLRVDTGDGQRCRWVDDAVSGFGRADGSTGHTAEVRMKVLKSTRTDRGVDIETYVGDGRDHLGRCFISVTRTGVYWYDTGPEPLAEGLDNHSSCHTYRLSVRPDGIAQIYRDSELLGVRRVPQKHDGMTKARCAYLQWGEGAGASEADAVFEYVAYDLSGAFAP